MDKSHLNLDFSSKAGFYLSQECELAKSWAEGRNGKTDQTLKRPEKCKGAEANLSFKGYNFIFVYQFDRLEYDGVDLTEKREEWEATVNHFRNGVSLTRTKHKELLHRFDKADYVFGAMSGSGSKIGKLEQKKDMQLCMKSFLMSENVSYDLKGIIYIVPKEQFQKKKK